jgi:hypothetical protein
MDTIGSHVDGDGDGDMFNQMVKLYSQRAWGGSAGGGADGLCELLLFSQRMPANTLLDMLLSR